MSVEPAQDSDEEEILNINLTQSDTPENDKWSVNIKIVSESAVQNRHRCRCNTLTIDSYQSLMHTGELKRSNRVLCSYSNHKVKPVPAVDLLAKYKNWETRTEFEIVNIAQQNVLSGTTAEALGLIMRLNSLMLPSKRKKKQTGSSEDIPTQSFRGTE